MGWAWWLLAERKKEGDVSATAGLDDDALEWQDMARDARDCLETCQMVGGRSMFPSLLAVELTHCDRS